MLAKCANPACSATFHYFHEGKLFAIESKIDPLSRERPIDPEYTGGPHGVQYFWLCSSCCRAMTVLPDGNQGVTVVHKGGVPPNISVMEDRVQRFA
ncbi:MAG TPA: hypothetical protein VEV41_24195 [Terriglobales bacterium]|nr:hypothetical protein [Terriglobales bacterium]